MAIKTSKDYKVAIIGYGWVGRAYHKMFSNAVIYDEPQRYCFTTGSFPSGIGSTPRDGGLELNSPQWVQDARIAVNDCDLALICVPTNLKAGAFPSNQAEMLQGVHTGVKSYLDMSIVEEVIGWLETPLILCKSALQPGTVDRLVKETGKKIAVSVELVGMGNYYTPPQYPDPKDPTKHQTLIIGGEPEVAEACAEILWSKMAPTITIHLISALEAEITKLVENTYGALKVTWVNTLMSLAQKSGASFIKIHQAWQSDPRVEGMHQRAVSFNRGWRSHCWDKDPYALASYAESIGATDLSRLINLLFELNGEHLESNERN